MFAINIHIKLGDIVRMCRASLPGITHTCRVPNTTRRVWRTSRVNISQSNKYLKAKIQLYLLQSSWNYLKNLAVSYIRITMGKTLEAVGKSCVEIHLHNFQSKSFQNHGIATHNLLLRQKIFRSLNENKEIHYYIRIR